MSGRNFKRRQDGTLDFKFILKHNCTLLSRCLVVSDELLFELKSVDYMRCKVSTIRQLATADQKVSGLLSMLYVVPRSQRQSVFSALLTALRHDGQEHVANIFSPESDARPMSVEHFNLFVDKQQQFCQCIDPRNGLVDELVVQKVFSDRDRNNITHVKEHDEKSVEVIQIIRRKQDAAFETFIGALVATKQEHVASLFGHPTTHTPLSGNNRRLLTSNVEKLSQFIDPTHTLLNELEAVGVLNEGDIADIERMSSYAKRSTELVNILLRKSDSSFDKFIAALNSTEQQHAVHILTGHGETPLSRVRRSMLRKARDRFASTVDIRHTALVDKLMCSGIITDGDKECIEAHAFSRSKAAQLLDVIARKSRLANDKFIQTLKDIGYREIDELLEGLELRGRIDPRFITSTLLPNRNAIVQFVTNDMQALVTGTGDAVQTVTWTMEQNGFAVSGIKDDDSIHISFVCFESLENLKRLYVDKTLDSMLTEAFCRRFADQGLQSLTLHITDKELERLAEAFERLQKCEPFSALPVEMLELVLMRSFVKLFYDHYKSHHKTHEAILVTYGALAAVCHNWWLTMNGWQQSTTKHWFKHKLHRALTYMCQPYFVSHACLQSSLPMSRRVYGVAVCDNKLFVVCDLSNSILVYGPNNTRQANITLAELDSPRDIVSCVETQQLFVAGLSRDFSGYVWRVSLGGHQFVRWLPNNTTTTLQFRPETLSVTSCRLLVTSQDNNELLLYGADGAELKRVPIPDTMTSLQHAVETSRGTFILSHLEPQPRVCEVNVDGHEMRIYCDQRLMFFPVYLSLASPGPVFVADYKDRVLLLNSETLRLERVLLVRQQHQLKPCPWRLCYRQQKRQLAVAFEFSSCVQLFTVS